MAPYSPAAGDVLFFSGRGPVSLVIAAVTMPWYVYAAAVLLGIGFWWAGILLFLWALACSKRITHCGVVVQWERDGDRRFYLVESTTLCTLPCAIQQERVRGGQAHLVYERIEHYDGRVYAAQLGTWYRLDEHESRRLAGRALKFIGQPYSRVGAMLAGTRLIKWWAAPMQMALHAFCSAMAVDLLKVVGRIGSGVHSGVVHPAGLARRLSWEQRYGPLKRIK